MPSFRKRHREVDEQLPPAGAVPASSMAVEQPAPVSVDLPDAGADAPPSSGASAAPVADESTILRARLAELERSEALQKARIASQMAQEPKPPAAPQLSERDLEFLGARPGVDKDPRLPVVAQAFAATLGHDTDEFYSAMANAFPVERYRRVEPQTNTNSGSELQRASEPPKPAPPPPRRPYNGPPLSAPVSREAPMASGMRPSSQQSVRLSPDQRDVASSIAASRGISQMEAERIYAAELLRMNRLKASGQIQNEG